MSSVSHMLEGSCCVMYKWYTNAGWFRLSSFSRNWTGGRCEIGQLTRCSKAFSSATILLSSILILWVELLFLFSWRIGSERSVYRKRGDIILWPFAYRNGSKVGLFSRIKWSCVWDGKQNFFVQINYCKDQCTYTSLPFQNFWFAREANIFEIGNSNINTSMPV